MGPFRTNIAVSRLYRPNVAFLSCLADSEADVGNDSALSKRETRLFDVDSATVREEMSKL